MTAVVPAWYVHTELETIPELSEELAHESDIDHARALQEIIDNRNAVRAVIEEIAAGHFLAPRDVDLSFGRKEGT